MGTIGWTVLLIAQMAWASPQDLHHQGRLFDAAGDPLQGGHGIDVALFAEEIGGAALWSEERAVVWFEDGYYALTLGEIAPLEPSLARADSLFLELVVDGVPVGQRVPLHAVPWALEAGGAAVARAVQGPVDATELLVNGTPLVDGSGQLLHLPVHTHDAGELATGTLAADLLPIGASAGQVAAGDHLHDAASVGPAAAPSVLGVVALRALEPTERLVWLRFHSAPEDRGGGLFRGVVGAVPGRWADDNGAVVVPEGGDGSSAWVRVSEAAPRPEWFGAVGDGLADDTAAVRSAVAAGQGRGVELARGRTYRVSTAGGSLELRTAHTRLFGGGALAAADAVHHLVAVTADDCVVEEIQLAGDGTFNAEKSVPSASRLSLLHVAANRALIRGNTFVEGHQNFVDLTGVQGATIADNVFLGGVRSFVAATDTGYQGLRVVDSNRVVVRGNRFDALNGGKVVEAIYLGNMNTADNGYHVVDGNVVSAAWDHGIYANVTYGTAVTHNQTTTDGSGLVCASKVDLSGALTYPGNICSDNQLFASPTLLATVGLYIRDASGTLCANNEVVGFPTGIQLTPITYSDPRLVLANNHITGNTVRGFTVAGVVIGAAGHTVGAIRDNVVSDNVLAGAGSDVGVGLSVVFPAGVSSHNRYVGNTLTTPGDVGVLLQYDEGGEVRGNAVHDAGSTGTTYAAGIVSLYGHGTVFADNTIRDARAQPLMKYGVDGRNTTTAARVEGNTVLGASVVPLRQLQQGGSGNAFAKNQTGSAPLTGTVTLSAGATTVVSNDNINAGLGYTSAVRLTPLNASAASLFGGAGHPWVGSQDMVGGVSFVVHAPAAGTEQLYYEILQ